jgi:hypothetical protein
MSHIDRTKVRITQARKNGQKGESIVYFSLSQKNTATQPLD